MRSPLLLATSIGLVFLGSFLARRPLREAEHTDRPPVRPYRRIVTTAPSLTETLYALGLGDRVVGVSRYCDYPPEVRQKPKVGGYHNPNFEAIVGLRPDLVILLAGDERSRSAFGKLGLTTLVVSHKNVEAILDSFVQIGRYGGVEDEAAAITADIEIRMERIRQKTTGLPRPRVLFVIERTVGHGRLEDVYVAGADGFFDKIIVLAGGQNAHPSATVRFPVISTEGILRMNPEVILDMTSGIAGGEHDNEAIVADWQQVGQVEAVRTGRVHAVDQDYAFRPGPRFILLVEHLARLIHPELDWEEVER